MVKANHGIAVAGRNGQWLKCLYLQRPQFGFLGSVCQVSQVHPSTPSHSLGRVNLKQPLETPEAAPLQRGRSSTGGAFAVVLSSAGQDDIKGSKGRIVASNEIQRHTWHTTHSLHNRRLYTTMVPIAQYKRLPSYM